MVTVDRCVLLGVHRRSYVELQKTPSSKNTISVSVYPFFFSVFGASLDGIENWVSPHKDRSLPSVVSDCEWMASSNSIWPEDFLIFPGLFLLLRCGMSCEEFDIFGHGVGKVYAFFITCHNPFTYEMKTPAPAYQISFSWHQGITFR